ncbi:hypothetical protein I79_004777 [Cricetulus griseus]|uniref:Uncharacterized protein n=1 Tax=Cricetulus griseus TaxID=10029 RepID=G3H3G1_CRIGR|nr:hypothetical protein I79_004777 [Cricetulus griseus]
MRRLRLTKLHQRPVSPSGAGGLAPRTPQEPLPPSGPQESVRKEEVKRKSEPRPSEGVRRQEACGAQRSQGRPELGAPRGSDRVSQLSPRLGGASWPADPALLSRPRTFYGFCPNLKAISGAAFLHELC